MPPLTPRRCAWLDAEFGPKDNGRKRQSAGAPTEQIWQHTLAAARWKVTAANRHHERQFSVALIFQRAMDEPEAHDHQGAERQAHENIHHHTSSLQPVTMIPAL